MEGGLNFTCECMLHSDKCSDSIAARWDKKRAARANQWDVSLSAKIKSIAQVESRSPYRPRQQGTAALDDYASFGFPNDSVKSVHYQGKMSRSKRCF
jgi:hypothetical protein